MDVNERNRIVKFGLVGIGNTITDFLIYTCLIWFNSPFIIANAVAFLLANIQGYVVNAKFTFSNSTSSESLSLQTYSRYLMGHLGSLVFGTAIIAVTISTLGPFTAKPIAVAAGFCLNYFVSKRFVFNKAGGQDKVACDRERPPPTYSTTMLGSDHDE